MSTDGRLPGVEWIENPNRGFTSYAFDWYPYKPVITMHMTVGHQLSRSYVAGHRVPPHLWYNPYTDELWQTQELDLAAKALYQQQWGDHWSNRHSYNIQVELVGVPVVNQVTYTDEQNRKIAERVIVPIVRWLRERGLPFDLNQVAYVTNSSGSASEFWHGRYSEQQLADHNGIIQHIVWFANDHWDCSVERLDLWAAHAKLVLGDSTVGGIVSMRVTGDGTFTVGVGAGILFYQIAQADGKFNPAFDKWNPVGAPEGSHLNKVAVNHHDDWINIYAIDNQARTWWTNYNLKTGKWGSWIYKGALFEDVATVAMLTAR